MQGFGPRLASKLAESFLDIKHRAKATNLLLDYTILRKDEILRASLISDEDERKLLEWLNNVTNAAYLANAVKGIGLGLANRILTIRENSGGGFQDYLDIELIRVIGGKGWQL